MFIHWGPFSILGDGEWVMNNRNITVPNYTRLMNFFDPVYFNAAEWVSTAKKAGMKYITLITRHHDGFSIWATKYSDFNIMIFFQKLLSSKKTEVEGMKLIDLIVNVIPANMFAKYLNEIINTACHT